jgi:hypothetical protein
MSGSSLVIAWIAKASRDSGLDMPTSREARESIDIARKFKIFIQDKINMVLRDW